jgi:hypothetical protein
MFDRFRCAAVGRRTVSCLDDGERLLGFAQTYDRGAIVCPVLEAASQKDGIELIRIVFDRPGVALLLVAQLDVVLVGITPNVGGGMRDRKREIRWSSAVDGYR